MNHSPISPTLKSDFVKEKCSSAKVSRHCIFHLDHLWSLVLSKERGNRGSPPLKGKMEKNRERGNSQFTPSMVSESGGRRAWKWPKNLSIHSFFHREINGFTLGRVKWRKREISETRSLWRFDFRISESKRHSERDLWGIVSFLLGSLTRQGASPARVELEQWGSSLFLSLYMCNLFQFIGYQIYRSIIDFWLIKYEKPLTSSSYFNLPLIQV